MRRLHCELGLMLVLGMGCSSGPLARNPNPPALTAPTTEQLVTHLNHQAKEVRSLEYDRASIDVKRGLQSATVNGMLAFQKPRNFRLMASALNATQADIGSNRQEFWFWFKQDQTLFHCAYEDFPRCRNLQMPIHPDWIAEALCVSEFGPANQYKLRTVGQTVEMTSETTSPQGQPLQKVTVVALSGPNASRVIGHRLRNAQGQDIWTADITEYQNVGGYVVPRKVTLKCPAEKMEVGFKLDGCKVNKLVAGRETFQRPSYPTEIDLARGGAPAGTPQSIQKVRGASD